MDIEYKYNNSLFLFGLYPIYNNFNALICVHKLMINICVSYHSAFYIFDDRPAANEHHNSCNYNVVKRSSFNLFSFPGD